MTGAARDRPDRRGRWPPLLPHFAGLAALVVVLGVVACRAVAAGRRGGGRRGAGLCPTIARHSGARYRGARCAAVRGRDGRLERRVPEHEPRRRHRHGGRSVRRLLHDDGGGPLCRRRAGRPVGGDVVVRTGGALAAARPRSHARDRPSGHRGDRLRPGRRRPLLRLPGGAVVGGAHAGSAAERGDRRGLHRRLFRLPRSARP